MRRSRSSRWRETARAAVPVLVILSFFLSACGRRPPPEFVGADAWTYLVKQCEFGPRTPGSPGHGSTQTLIIDELRKAGAHVRLQRFRVQDPYGSGELQLTNIIGSFYPDEKRRFLLAAHYDTRPWADQEEDVLLHSQPIMGANDGASGVAVLLEMAGILTRHRPKRLGVDLVFFDGEDYGKSGDLQFYLLGSRHFAANLGGYRPTGGILLDMVGARDATIRQEGNSLDHAPKLTAEIFVRAQNLGLDIFVPERSAPIIDDHVPLLQAGIPVVDLIGLPYPYWHTLADTPDKCSQQTLRSVGTLVVDIIYDIPQP